MPRNIPRDDTTTVRDVCVSLGGTLLHDKQPKRDHERGALAVALIILMKMADRQGLSLDTPYREWVDELTGEYQ